MINFTDNLILTIDEFINDNRSILDVIRAPLYKASDSYLTYKQINDLDEAGLVHDPKRSQNKWRRFSLYDLFYLELAQSVKKRLDKTGSINYFKDSFYNKKIKQDDLAFELYYGEYAFIATILNIFVALFAYPNGKTVLTDIINSSSLLGMNPELEGGVVIRLENFSKSSLNKYSDLFSKYDIEKYQNHYEEIDRGDVTDYKEKTLLNLIEFGGYSKITLEKSEGEILFRGSNSKFGQKFTAEDILKLVDSKPFGDIEIIKQDGEIIGYRFTELKKI